MGGPQDNEWSRKAKDWAQRFHRDPSVYLREQKKTATGGDLIAIETAEKFLNYRNKKKARRGAKPMSRR
jgi:hypothetical protein